MERVQMCAVPPMCKAQIRAKSPPGRVGAESEGMDVEANTR
jgi:hypothetical protein